MGVTEEQKSFLREKIIPYQVQECGQASLTGQLVLKKLGKWEGRRL